MNAIKRKMLFAALFMIILSIPVFSQVPPGVSKDIYTIIENNVDCADWYLYRVYVDTSLGASEMRLYFKTKGIVTEEYQLKLNHINGSSITYDATIIYYYLGDDDTWTEVYTGTANCTVSIHGGYGGTPTNYWSINYNGPKGERINKTFDYRGTTHKLSY